ncbi:hypothetical protein YC2023_049256 [Brassica napus]
MEYEPPWDWWGVWENAAAVAFKNGRLRIEAPVRLSHAESWQEGVVIHCKGYRLHPREPDAECTRAGGSTGTQQEKGRKRDTRSESRHVCPKTPRPETPVGNGEGAGVSLLELNAHFSLKDTVNETKTQRKDSKRTERNLRIRTTPEKNNPRPSCRRKNLYR